MAESSWPTVAASRVVTDDQFELMTQHWSADGVEAPLTTTPVFGDSSGRQVKVRANVDAIVGGHGYNSGTTDIIKSVTANASGSTRIDSVVLSLDRTTWAVTSSVKAGTPGAGTPPALVQNSRGSSAGVWEIPLAMVTVINGAATISASDVTNIAWYTSGSTVATTSTNPLQPSATLYAKMRHTDTGVEYTSVAGVWRRSPWSVAWGVIGGQRYSHGTGTVLVLGGGGTEVLANISSGSVTLRANRRYRVRAYVLPSITNTSAVLTLRIRDTNVSGTVRGSKNVSNGNTGYVYLREVVGEYTTGGSDETKTFVVTSQVNGGLYNLHSGDTGNLVGLFVEDVGPSVPNVVTVLT